MARTSIDWTEMSWNPCTGCTKISPGCANCYAETMSNRLRAMGLWKYRNGFGLTMHSETLGVPYRWKNPKRIFVNSMSDLFHKDIPTEFVLRVFRVMNENPQHIFQVLTKRADMLYALNDKLNWTSNIWMGVTIENKDTLFRMDFLKNTASQVKFISFEPLLGPIGRIQLKGIDWVIVGGESGPKARAMDAEWVREILDQCRKASVPFFFKQWGGHNKGRNGHSLDGKKYRELPKLTAA
jgi:protein gp37